MHTDPHITEKKLQRCIPHLIEAADSWQANGLADAPLLLAVASTTRAVVLRADSWPPSDPECSREEAAAALIVALEEPVKPEIVVAAVSRLIGPEGRAAHLESVATIRGRNQIAVLMMMVGDVDTVVATTTGVPRPTLH